LGDSTYSVSVSAALTPAQSVSQKALTATGVTASSKYYDATTNATLAGGSLVGVLTGDAGNVSLVPTGFFTNAGPGTVIGIDSTSTLTGSAAANYTLTQPTGLSADIYTAAVWTNTASGPWKVAGSWNPNLVPSGANVTADFTTLNPTADTLVNLTNAQTIGNLKFGDTDTSSAAGWVITNNNSSANSLTLAGTAPTITVNALGGTSRTLVTAVVAGTNGLVKAGAGTLALTGANTYSGSTVISNGTVVIDSDARLGAVPASPTSGSISLQGGALQTTVNMTINANRSITVGSSGGTLTNSLGSGANQAFAGLIEGSGTLTFGAISGGGFLITSPNSTYNGGSIFAGQGSVFFMVNSIGTPGSLTSGPFGTGKITFNGASTRSTSGNSITNGNAIDFAADTTFATIASEKSLTLNGPVTLVGASRTLTVNIGATVATEALTLNGAIGDAANGYGLTKAGTGKLILTGTNTYTGATAVTGGTLALAKNNTLNQYNNVSVSSSATLALGTGDGSTGWSAAQIDTLLGTSGFTLSSGAILGFDTSVGDFTYGNSISGSPGYGLSKFGNNTLTLSGANTYTGPTAITAGTLLMGSSSALGTTSALSMSGTGALDLGGNNLTIPNITASVAGNTITNSGAGSGTDTLNITNLTVAIAAKVTDNGTRKVALTLSGSTIDPLSNANNDFSGGLNLSSAIRLTAVDNSPITGGKFGKGPITIGTAAQVYFSGANKTIGNDFIVNDATGNGSRAGSFRVDTAGNILSGTITANQAPATFACGGGTGGITLTGKVTGTNGLTVSNPNGTSMTLTLNITPNLSDYEGATTIANSTATVTLGAADQIPNGVGKGNFAATFGTLNLAGFSETINALTGAGNVDGASGTPTLTLGDGDAGGTFSGVIKNNAGTLSLTKIGIGTQILSGANTYTGPTLISAGKLQIGAAGTVGALSASSVITNNATLAFNRTDTITQGTQFATGITGTGGLSQDGSGTTILNSANTYDGSTTVTAGALNLQHANALGSTVGGTVVTAGRVELQGVTIAGESITVNGGGGNAFGALQGASGVNEWQGGVTVGSASGTRVGVNTGTFTVSGAIGGGVATNGITFRPNTGTLILSGANSYLGDTTFICGGGIVRLAGGNDRLPIATRLFFGGTSVSGILDLNGTSQEIAGLGVVSGTANLITNSSGTLSKLNVNTPTGTNSTWSQTLAGNLDLIKSGPARLTLSGVNTYSGLTTVSNGTLLVNGTIVSAPTVQTNATLGGTGIIGGTVTVQAGAILAPGASVGTLILSNAPSLGGTILAELDQATAQKSDKLVLTNGTLTYGGTLVVTNIGPALTNQTFTLFSAPAYAGSFSSITLPAGGSLHWATNNLTVNGTISYTNNPVIASNAVVTRAAGVEAKVRISNLAADLDGDAISLSYGNTTNGVTTTTDGTFIYFPAASVDDALSFTVTDGLGITNSGTVSVTIVAASGQSGSINMTNNVASLTFFGVPGTAYNVERSTNGMSTWQVITNLVAPTNAPIGVISLTNDVSGLDPVPASAFYRLAVP
jgi:autotransporter-associated beta strand protein